MTRLKLFFKFKLKSIFILKIAHLTFFIKVNGVNHIRYGIQASLRHEQNKHKEFKLLTLQTICNKWDIYGQLCNNNNAAKKVNWQLTIMNILPLLLNLKRYHRMEAKMRIQFYMSVVVDRIIENYHFKSLQEISLELANTGSSWICIHVMRPLIRMEAA